MKKPATLQEAVTAARKRGATDFNKDYRGKLLISFSCVENGKRYAYFHEGDAITRAVDYTDYLIEKIEHRENKAGQFDAREVK